MAPVWHAAGRTHFGIIVATRRLPHNLGQVLLRLAELDEAEARLRDSLVIAQKWGNPVLLASPLAGIAGATTARGRPERAAGLFGAASMLIERWGGVLDVTGQLDWDHHYTAAGAALSVEAWDAAFAQGRAMTEEEVRAVALEPLDSPAPSATLPGISTWKAVWLHQLAINGILLP